MLEMHGLANQETAPQNPGGELVGQRDENCLASLANLANLAVSSYEFTQVN
jgi:hypothetical protein